MSEVIQNKEAIETADTAIEAARQTARIMEEARFDRLKDRVVEDVSKSLEEHIANILDDKLDGYRNAIFDLRNQVGHLTRLLNAVYADQGIDFDVPVYKVQQIDTVTEDLKDKAFIVQFIKGENDVVQLKTFSYDGDEKKEIDLTQNPILYQAFTNELRSEVVDRFELDKEYYFLLSIVTKQPNVSQNDEKDDLEEVESTEIAV